MDFNVKKLVGDAGTLFTRAVQVSVVPDNNNRKNNLCVRIEYFFLQNDTVPRPYELEKIKTNLLQQTFCLTACIVE